MSEATAEDAFPAQLSLAEAEQILLAHGLDLLIAEYGAQGAAAQRFEVVLGRRHNLDAQADRWFGMPDTNRTAD